MPFRLVWFWRYELLWPHSDNHLHAVVEHALEPPRPLVHRAASSVDCLTMFSSSSSCGGDIAATALGTNAQELLLSPRPGALTASQAQADRHQFQNVSELV